MSSNLTKGDTRCFSTLPSEVRVLWAKSGEAGGHSLLAHLLDVAAVAEVLLEIEPPASLDWAAAGFGLPREYCARWLAALVGLHDYGKAISGFQAKWEEGRRADQDCGLDFSKHTLSRSDHSCATAALLDRDLLQLSDADLGWLRHAVQAISAHHGYHFSASDIRKSRPSDESNVWRNARKDLLTVYWQTLAPQGKPNGDELSLPVVNWLAGLTSTADWIASNPEWFPLGNRGCDDLSAYYTQARKLAQDALPQLGWRPWQLLLHESLTTQQALARILGREEVQMRPLQEIGDRLLQTAQGPALLMVEAPMGEGKTELAFLAHLRLQANNGHRGLYIALPTQATGNALFTRALRFLESFAEKELDVQLVHGAAAMNDDIIRLRGIDAQDEEQALSVSSWFSQRRRPLLSPYGVGTVDQALFSTLNVKHHFVRLWGLGNRVVVLDEVHAYDDYTSGLIEALLRWLKALGSSVIIMSATLPEKQRDRLLQAWGVKLEQVPKLAYPRILLADQNFVRGDHVPARPLPEVHLHGLGVSIEEIAAKAIELLEGDGCGAVIVNTVDRAQALYSVLRERLDTDVSIVLFHACFSMRRRSELERKVLSLFGPTGSRPQRALLVATQVAEQSLDLDFDFMLSDLAPVDLLLQRLGRLHRHLRSRPVAHQQARLWVAGLQPDFPDLEETAWGYVYDAYILGRTWALLGQESILQLPDDIDRLVQAVYDTGTPLPDGVDVDIVQRIETSFWGKYLAEVKEQCQLAQNIVVDPGAEAHAAYDGKLRDKDEDDLTGQRNLTRLGDESVTVIPVSVVGGGWQVDGQIFEPDHPIDDALARQLYVHQLRLSRVAVVKHFQAQPQPLAFAEHPLLKNVYALPLTGGVYVLSPNLHLRLDDELGLVYLPQQSDESPV